MTSAGGEIPQSEIERQREHMARVRARNDTADAPRCACVQTFGCQQNVADSERIRGMLIDMGYTLCDRDDADVVIINTCAVREHAEARVFGVIGALTHKKRENPDMIIAVCGCMAQQDAVAERIRRSHKHVDLVFGTHALWRFPELLDRTALSRERVFETADESGSIAEGLPSSRDGTCKAWLSVMYGCNNFCSYCIVPYVRGRERSRRPENIIDDAKRLIADGARDITLLGQNVNSYGGGAELDFPELLRMVGDIPGDFLIRFMTSHPKDAGERLFRAMARTPKVARQLHLPFQSGSTKVLRRMNRGYTRERYLELIAMARELMPDIVLTSDVIVGFPGETLEDFEDTMSLIETVRFDALFTFLYSKRPNTPAASLVDNTPQDEKQRRFERLVERQNDISGEIHSGYVGKTLTVLADAYTDDADYPVSGRTNGNRLVRMTGGTVGEFTRATITGSTKWALTALAAASAN
jgi:tRNA-2-methylthio-N6-dimethylallyladenosine synthase